METIAKLTPSRIRFTDILKPKLGFVAIEVMNGPLETDKGDVVVALTMANGSKKFREVPLGVQTLVKKLSR